MNDTGNPPHGDDSPEPSADGPPRPDPLDEAPTLRAGSAGGPGRPPAFAAAAGEGTLLAGQFRLVSDRPLRRDDLGEVWLARDTELGALVSVTLLWPAWSERDDLRADLRRRVAAARELTHPNLARLYGLYRAGPVQFLVSEHVEGTTLADILAEAPGPLAWRQVLSVARQVAEALDYARQPSPHSSGVSHEGLEPGRIVVGPDGAAKVVDFCLAGAVRRATVAAGRRSPYDAPEWLEGRSPGPAGDVYSLAAVLYACFGGPDPSGGFRLLPEQSAATNRALREAMSADPVRRPPSAKALVDRLAEGPPMGPPPPTTAAQAPAPGPAVGPQVLARAIVPAVAVCLALVVVLPALFRGSGQAPAPSGPGGPGAPGVPSAAAGPPAAPSLPARPLVDGIGMRLVWVPAGSFLMGSDDRDPDARADERPQHRVTLTRGFYIGATEVTQAQWRAVMGTRPWTEHPWVPEGPDHPAGGISWQAAHEFCRCLSRKEGFHYRLPTEAEWEYACRAGTSTRFFFGDEAKRFDAYGRAQAGLRDFGTGGSSQRVAARRPNAWGLYDTCGNLYEWCADWYHARYYATAPTVDSPGPPTGDRSSNPFYIPRVCRGGCYYESPNQHCRSAARGTCIPEATDATRGFRVVREPVAWVEAASRSAGPERPGPLGAEAVGTLVTALNSGDDDAQKHALETIRNAGPAAAAAAPAVARIWEKADWDRRVLVVETLGAIGPAGAEASIPVLLRALQADHGSMGGAIVQALGQAARGRPEASEVVPALTRSLDLLAGSSGQNDAILALAGLGEAARPAVKELAALTLTKYPGDAPKALFRLGPVAVESIPQLIQAARKGGGFDWLESRRYVACALGAMGRPALRPILKALADMEGDTGQRVGAYALSWAFARACEVAGRAIAPELTAQLQSPSSLVQRAAAMGLCALGPTGRETERALAAALEYKDAEVRRHAARALGAQGLAGAEAAVEALRGPAGPASEATREVFVLAHVHLGPAKAPGPLRRWSKDDSPAVRQAAVAALRRVGLSCPQAGEVLVGLLQDPDASVRADAAAAMGRFPKRATALMAALADKEPAVRRAAEEAVGELAGTVYAAMALSAALGEEPDSTKKAVSAALARRGPITHVASAALGRALGQLASAPAGGTTRPPEPIAELVQALQSEQSGVRVYAARRLGDRGEEAREAVGELVPLLFDREPLVRKAAAEALGKIGPAAKVAVPVLATWLPRRDSAARVAADVLGQLGPDAAPYLAHSVEGMKKFYAERDWGRLDRALARMERKLRRILKA